MAPDRAKEFFTMKHCLLLAAAFVAAPAVAADSQPSIPAPQAASDPTQSGAARAVVDRIFPAGTYARMMDKSMDAVMGSVLVSLDQMSLRDLSRIGGTSEAELRRLGDGSLKQMMEIADPAYHQRIERATRVMVEQMSAAMTRFEPGIRDGLAQVYARRFSAAQLGDLDTFFNTPTGRIYAAESMMLLLDPEVMDRMQAMMPELLKEMPAMIVAMEQATADLPKARTYGDLRKDERARLAKLLGISETELAKRQKD